MGCQTPNTTRRIYLRTFTTLRISGSCSVAGGEIVRIKCSLRCEVGGQLKKTTAKFDRLEVRTENRSDLRGQRGPVKRYTQTVL